MAAHLRRALSLANLRIAFDRVKANAGQPGVDGQSVEDFGVLFIANLKALQAEVLGGRYCPQPLKRVWLPRPAKPPRPLGVPTVRDRVLQTAVAVMLTPILEAEFEDCSFAYRQGRSVRQAVERITLLQRQGYRWVVEADIERFFDTIPHDKLLAELRALVPDDELIVLVRSWLTAPVQEGGRLRPTSLGVPQGSPISPLLANLYLDHLDETLLGENFALVRYADDFIVLAKSRERAEEAVELSREVLHDLELKLNPLKTRVVNFETGFQFLGWNFVRSLTVPARRATQSLGEKTFTNVRVESEKADVPTSPTAAAGRAVADIPPNKIMAGAFAEALAQEPDWKPVALGQFTNPPVEYADIVLDQAMAQASDEAAAEPEADSSDAAPAATPVGALQRTLYLVDPAVSLSTQNRRLVVKKDEAVILDLPAVNVDQVMLFGRQPRHHSCACRLHAERHTRGLSLAAGQVLRTHGAAQPRRDGALATSVFDPVNRRIDA